MNTQPLDPDSDGMDTTPAWYIWPAVADIMVCLLGIFVLLFVWSTVLQIEIEAKLKAEQEARQAEAKRLQVLEQALAKPVAEGRITLSGARIAMQGSVLFKLGSAELSSEGHAIIEDIVEPLGAYSEQSEVSVMVSGFTDDQPFLGITSPFRDNWELSTERALTVMRALVAAGFPHNKVFAAGFGEYKPVAPNVSDENRARNRRVEITPVPTLESIPPP
ncbi:MAG: OmpA family protein [Beggiatoa sp.]|nr:OmpA family protein [Beggiatoa sp.]